MRYASSAVTGLPPSLSLLDRVALVTGASRGIGRAIASVLAARGATVAVNYARSENAAASLCSEIEASGGRAIGVGFDVADEDAVAAGVKRVDVESTFDLARACREQFPAHDLLLMAAAPADFTVADTSNEKLSRTGGEFTLTLVPTEDILAGLSANRIEGQTVVGFAAQHGGDAIGRARQKLERKGADMIVLNDVSDKTIGFDSSQNAVTLVTPDGELEVDKAPKTEIADRILDRALELRSA